MFLEVQHRAAFGCVAPILSLSSDPAGSAGATLACTCGAFRGMFNRLVRQRNRYTQGGDVLVLVAMSFRVVTLFCRARSLL